MPWTRKIRCLLREPLRPGARPPLDSERGSGGEARRDCGFEELDERRDESGQVASVGRVAVYFDSSLAVWYGQS